MEPTSSANGRLQSVTRALSVLACFRNGENLGVSAIARQLDLPVSTTHRLLSALVEAGFLDKVDSPSRYRLGTTLAEYGQLAYRQHRIHLAEPRLEELATITGAKASIATRHGNDAVLLGTSSWREADGHELQGLRLPLHASALGKALLAWAQTSEEELTWLPYDSGTARSISGPVELGKELAHTRERGYAFNDEELVRGFRTIGVPIGDEPGQVRFALGLRGPVELMIDERVPFFVDLAKVTARKIADVLH
ncbi:IclR family transcriptional regulator [Nocardia jinanensis]|uniref:IclR family transcriptional regulator n=1 Tax=Nocardia jinanensis TaxID=382504 RepID=A0A917RF98_9NOCA|nr:IclR family transcriptional regulator [Nocardia jinanensis]GGL03519.1 IclR family transcriptional regulator [Nocardia jinanensis]